MIARKAFFAGNWKMHGTRREAADLAKRLRDLLGGETDREMAVFPPFLAIETVRDALAGSPIRVGAQTCHYESAGAYTGEVSPGQLVDAGCELVLVGHSERREYCDERDEVVRKKLEAALGAGLDPILCVGETRPEREAGRTDDIIRMQAVVALENLPEAEMERVTVAYEPVWAIGTGLTATPEQAEEVHAYLRGLISRLHSAEIAARTRIQYGGSVKPDNIGGLMREPDIDGALVGGASLDPESFAGIVRYGRG